MLSSYPQAGEYKDQRLAQSRPGSQGICGSLQFVEAVDAASAPMGFFFM